MSWENIFSVLIGSRPHSENGLIQLSVTKFVGSDNKTSGPYVSFREFKLVDGQERPTRNGICLTGEEYLKYQNKMLEILDNKDSYVAGFEDATSDRKFWFEKVGDKFTIVLTKPNRTQQKWTGHRKDLHSSIIGDLLSRHLNL